MKILVGTFDTAGLLNSFADGFRKLGHEVTTVVRKKNRFYPNNSFDVESEPDGILSTKVLTELIESHDIFLFQRAGESLMPDNNDFRLLNKYGKKIIQVFNGDDVRHHSAYKQWCGIDLTQYSTFYAEDPLERPLRNIRTSEYYADLIFSLQNQSSLAVRPYMHSILPVDLSKYKLNIPKRDIPVIVHAPSDENIKGTQFILAALERLETEGYKFELRLLKEKTNQEVIDQLHDADIAIDQLYILLYGVLPLEAMASGCAVATVDNKGKIKESFPPDRPIFHIDQDNLYEQLKELITNKKLRIQLAEQGRKFVEKYHDSTKVAGRILDVLNSEELTYDYYPTFFLEEYVLPQAETISEDVKELTLKIIQRWGLPANIKLKDLVKRGFLPDKLDTKLAIKRWSEKNQNISVKVKSKTAAAKDEKLPLEPKFTIAIFTYNRADRIKKSIDSSLKQTCQDYEILIIDDGSIDNTEEVVKGYNSSKIRYIKKEHSGISKSRNCAIVEARGEFIIWLADDDELAINTLEEYLKYIEKYPDADVLYCQLQITDSSKRKKLVTPKDWYGNKEGLLSALVVGTPIPDGGSAVRKKVYDIIGVYNTSFKRAMDYEFWSRVVQSQQFEVKLVDTVQYTYYIHENNITGILNSNTDYSFEAKILENILENTPIELLYNEYDWINDQVNSKAEAFYLTAAKFLSYNDLSNSKKYFEESVKLKPELKGKNAKITQIFDNSIQEDKINKEQPRAKEEIKMNNQYQEEIDKIIENVNNNNNEQALFLIKNLLTIASLKDTIGESVYLELLNLAGTLSLIVQDYESAQYYYEQELNNNPTSARACIGLGEVYFAAQMFNESKTMFEWAVKYEPLNDDAINGLNKANDQLGFAGGHNTLIQENLSEMIIKSEELIHQDKYEEASNVLIDVLEKYPDNMDALNNLVVARILLGDYNKALDLLEKVLEFDENNEIAIENLKYLMTISGVNPDKTKSGNKN